MNTEQTQARISDLEKELKAVLDQRSKLNQEVQDCTRKAYELLGALNERKRDINANNEK